MAETSAPRVGVIIRFKDSAATLPAVLAALAAQTLQPAEIVAVDSGSRDGSRALLEAAGARILDWRQPYHHSRVLNFALGACVQEFVAVLSSHTVMEDTDALERMVRALGADGACASGCWDDDPFFSEEIDWAELQAKGIKFGSIYSNSMGVLRRSRWEAEPFDETLVGMEDYAWALSQVRQGWKCCRVRFRFRYLRSGGARDFALASIAFQLAARHGLRVRWLGPKATALAWWRALRSGDATERALQSSRFRAWLYGRFQRQTLER